MIVIVRRDGSLGRLGLASGDGQILLQGAQQTFGLGGRENHPAAHLGPPTLRLYIDKIESELGCCSFSSWDIPTSWLEKFDSGGRHSTEKEPLDYRANIQGAAAKNNQPGRALTKSGRREAIQAKRQAPRRQQGKEAQAAEAQQPGRGAPWGLAQSPTASESASNYEYAGCVRNPWGWSCG